MSEVGPAGALDAAVDRTPDTSHVQWSALPDLVDDGDLVPTAPSEEPPPDQRRPPPETIWGAI